MMKLKVVDNYMTVSVVDADTIDNLKAQIMKRFSLTDNDLSQRLLVRDGRAPATDFRSPKPMANGFNLLELEEGSILKDHFCSHCLDDDDTLLLGWNDPFIIRLVLPAPTITWALSSSFKIKVNHNDTLGHLKKEIEIVTKNTVKEDNLPKIFLEVDDNKPLLFFGFYNYYKRFKDDYDGGDAAADDAADADADSDADADADADSDADDDADDGDERVQFYINCNCDNKLVLTKKHSVPRLSIYRTEPEMPRYFGGKFDRDEESKKLKVDTMDQYGERILVPHTETFEMPKGMEGDKEDAGSSYKPYQLSKKELKYIENACNDTMKQRRKKKKKKKIIGRFSILRTPMESRGRSRGQSVPSRARPGCTM